MFRQGLDKKMDKSKKNALSSLTRLLQHVYVRDKRESNCI